jgi:tetratricopeptide (TPR) repeat protein
MEETKPKAGLRIFLSYAHDDHAELADRLCQDLKERPGYEVRFDKIDLRPGTDWECALEQGLDWVTADAENGRVILLMTPGSVTRPGGYCLNEVTRAIGRRLYIVPVMVVAVEPPLSICRIQYLDMTDCLPLASRSARYESKRAVLIDVLERRNLEFEGVQSRVLKALRPLDCPDLSSHLTRFTGREWLIEKIDAWIKADRGPRVFWITGGPGSGKSALACWLSNHRREVGALHFCQHSDLAGADPRNVVRTIAYNLSSQLPGYMNRLAATPNLEEICQEAGAASLWDKLITQPIHDLPLPDRRILIVIDGLDEATQDGANELARFLSEEITKLPDWIRLLITSRPEPEVMQPLQDLEPFVLAADSPENVEDMKKFVTTYMQEYAPGGKIDDETMNQILAVSEKNWLYAELLLDALRNGRRTLDNVAAFPQGLGGAYTTLFDRRFGDKREEYQRRDRRLMEVVAAACEPLPLEYISDALGLTAYEAHGIALAFGSLLTSDGGRIRAFHKSLIDWLVDPNRSFSYWVIPQEGHKTLAAQGWKEYTGEKPPLSEYMTKYLPVHFSSVKEAGKLFECATDAAYLLAASETDSHYGVARFWKDFDMAKVRQSCEQSFQKWTQTERDQQRVYRMSLCLGQLFQHAGSYGDAIRYFERASAICAAGLDRNAAGGAYLNTGRCLRHMDAFDEAIVQLDQAAECFLASGNKAGMAAALSMKGLCLWHKQAACAALECLRQALGLFEEVKDHRGRAEALNFIGIVYRSVGLYDEALENLHGSEEIYSRLNDLKGGGQCANSLGTAYWWSGDYTQAIHYYQEANAINERINQPYVLGLTATNLGYVYLEKCEYAKSLEEFSRARSIRRTLGTEPYEMMDVSGMARAYFQSGETGKAKELSRAAIERLKTCETVEDLAWAYYNHYVIMKDGAEGERAEGMSALARARDIVRKWLDAITDPGMRRNAEERVPLVREILGTAPATAP